MRTPRIAGVESASALRWHAPCFPGLVMNDALRKPLMVVVALVVTLLVIRGFAVDLGTPAPMDRGTYAAAGLPVR
jgi:hypothetical protein